MSIRLPLPPDPNDRIALITAKGGRPDSADPAPSSQPRLLIKTLLLWALLWFGTAATAAITPPDKLKADKLKVLETQIDALRGSLDTTQHKHQNLRLQLRQAETIIGKLSINLKNQRRQIKNKQRRLTKLNQSKNKQNQDVQQHRETLRQQVISAYIIGRQAGVKILFNGENPAMIGRTLIYYDYFNRARASEIQQLDKKLKALEETKVAINQQKTQLESLHSDTKQQQSARLKQQNKRHHLLKKLNNDINTQERSLKELLEEKAALENLIQDIHQQTIADVPLEMGDIALFSSRKKRLTWPTKGVIKKRFGASRKVGGLKWQGVQIKAKEGQDVKSIYHGRVLFSDWLRGYGLLTIIDHGNNYISLYGHNQSLYKTVGDWVEEGDIIAAVGNSGGHASAGLYFEIRHNTTPQNPAHWCIKQ